MLPNNQRGGPGGGGGQLNSDIKLQRCNKVVESEDI